MFGWFKRPPQLPLGWVRLYSPPFDADGPIWTDEIETATQQFGREFRAPVMYEIEPGQCPCVYVAKTVYETLVRTYEGRATLIQRKNDEFRTAVFVTAPAAYSWDACNVKYSASIAKDQVQDVIQIIREFCERLHTEEMRRREEEEMQKQEQSEGSGDELDAIVGNTLKSIERSVELLSAPTDHDLLKRAKNAKGHISPKAVSDEYDRLVWQKLHPEDRSKVTVEFTPWEVIERYNELNRVYKFTNIAGPGVRTTIELRCRLEIEQERHGIDSLRRKVTPFVYLIFHPNILADNQFVAVFFAPKGDVKKYKILHAKLEKAESDQLTFVVFDVSDGEHLVNVLMLSRPIVLRILRGVPPFEWLQAAIQENAPAPPTDLSLINILLPNDDTFEIEYEAFRNTLLQ